jgi:hypothetical protein
MTNFGNSVTFIFEGSVKSLSTVDFVISAVPRD